MRGASDTDSFEIAKLGVGPAFLQAKSADDGKGAPAEQDGWSLAARAEESLERARAAAKSANDDANRKRGRQEELDGICETLRQTEVFANLDERELSRLARGCTEQFRSENQFIFRIGDPSDAVYVIREGSVDILRDERGKPLERLARLGAGEIFGELGVLHGVERSASVRAAEGCRLLRMGKLAFLRVLEANAVAEAKLETLAAQRHCNNSAAALHVRKDPRIRIDARMVLLPAAEERQVTRLEDISQGGLAMTGVPATWQPEDPVSFTLVSGSERLCVIGRVAWRRDETVGVAFTGDIPGHGHRVSRFTQELLEELN